MSLGWPIISVYFQFSTFLLACVSQVNANVTAYIVNINEHPGSPLPALHVLVFTPHPWLGTLISCAFSQAGGRSFDRGNELCSQAPRTT